MPSPSPTGCWTLRRIIMLILSFLLHLLCCAFPERNPKCDEIQTSLREFVAFNGTDNLQVNKRTITSTSNSAWIDINLKDNTALCNRMFDVLHHPNSLTLLVTNIIKIELVLLEGKRLVDSPQIRNGQIEAMVENFQVRVLGVCRIVTIEGENFANVSRLESLDLSRNNLIQLVHQSFVGSTQLPKLSGEQ
jgi:Leucine-rich repeat (LRR) protein